MSRNHQRSRRAGRYLVSTAGFDSKDVAKLCSKDQRQAYVWMRGPGTPFITFVGVLYGLALTLLLTAVLVHATPTSSAQLGPLLLILVVCAVALVEASVFMAWAINERILRSADPFYRYGRACHALIMTKRFTPDRLESRRHLATVVGRWATEGRAKHVDITRHRIDLEHLVDQDLPSADDLSRASAIGRAAALELLQGRVDMRALTPELVARREPSWIKRRLEAIFKYVSIATPFIGGVAGLLKLVA